MTPTILIDAGPLVAFLNRADAYHPWAKAKLAEMTPPLLTCEAVVAEAWHLLGRARAGREPLLELVRRGSIRIAFDLNEQVQAIQKLVRRYAVVPISLADASLVRMSELYAGARVFTVDADFRIYRRHGREAIPVILPDA